MKCGRLDARADADDGALMKLFARLIACVCALGVLRGETVLTISAAASLKDALMQVQALYAHARPEVKLAFNFGGSGVLQQQIAAGAPVDVFISAAAAQMDVLEGKGLLLAGTQRSLLTNRLVLITPKGATRISAFGDLAKPDTARIAIGDPKSAPAGAYAVEILNSLGLASRIESKLVRMLDVRQVLTAVETGNADAGFVYITDARLSDKVRIATTADRSFPIVYPIAVIRDTKQPDAARAFADFLTSTPARAAFEAFGFGTQP